MACQTICKKSNAFMKRMLGEQETLLLAYTQMRDSRTVRTGELLRPLDITKDQERELFRRLLSRRLSCCDRTVFTA
jgi:hypothetical protein